MCKILARTTAWECEPLKRKVLLNTSPKVAWNFCDASFLMQEMTSVIWSAFTQMAVFSLVTETGQLPAAVKFVCSPSFSLCAVRKVILEIPESSGSYQVRTRQPNATEELCLHLWTLIRWCPRPRSNVLSTYDSTSGHKRQHLYYLSIVLWRGQIVKQTTLNCYITLNLSDRQQELGKSATTWTILRIEKDVDKDSQRSRKMTSKEGLMEAEGISISTVWTIWRDSRDCHVDRREKRKRTSYNTFIATNSFSRQISGVCSSKRV